MSSNLNAVYEELRRLQKEGVDRIYIDDQTSSLLVPAKATPVAVEASKAPQPTSAGVNLMDLIDQSETPTDAVKTEPVLKPKEKSSPFKPIPAEGPVLEIPAGDAAERLQWLRETVLNCPICKEHLSDNGQIVFGEGAVNADILICGDAPSTDDALAGRPFMDNSGDLLTKIITAMGLKREAVYLTTALKWRPEHETPYGCRPPNSEELNFCLPYLRAQLEIIQPKVIIALGRAVVNALFSEDEARKFGALRGNWKTFEGVPVMVTFNPAYLLQNDTLKTKRKAWEDLLQVMEKLDLPISEKQRAFFLPKQ